MVRCSKQHLEEYENAINQYLSSKNITDLTKYQISFKEGKLHYISWEYDVEKPQNIKGFSKPKNYVDLHMRKLILHIPSERKYYYYNVDGEIWLGERDRRNRFIQSIVSIHVKQSNGSWDTPKTNPIFINNGIIVVNNKDNEPPINGEVHIIILY